MNPIHINKTILSPLIDELMAGRIPDYKGIYLGTTSKLTALEEATWCADSTVTYNAKTKQLTYSMDIGTETLYNGDTGVITDVEDLTGLGKFAKTYEFFTANRTKGCSKTIIIEEDQYKYIQPVINGNTIELNYTRPDNILNVDNIEVPITNVVYKISGTDTVIPGMDSQVSQINNYTLRQYTELNHIELDVFIDGYKLPVITSIPVDNRVFNVTTYFNDVINGVDTYRNITSSTGAKDEFTEYTYYLNGTLFTDQSFQVTDFLVGKPFVTLLSENPIVEANLADVSPESYIAREDIVIKPSNIAEYYYNQGYYTYAGRTLSGTEKEVTFELRTSTVQFVEDINNYEPLYVDREEYNEPFSKSLYSLAEIDDDTLKFLDSDTEFPKYKLGFKQLDFLPPTTVTPIKTKEAFNQVFNYTAPNDTIVVDLDGKIHLNNLVNSSGVLKSNHLSQGNKLLSITIKYTFNGNQSTAGRASLFFYDTNGYLLREFGLKRNLDYTTTLKRNGLERVLNQKSFSIIETYSLASLPEVKSIGFLLENNVTDTFNVENFNVTMKDNTW